MKRRCSRCGQEKRVCKDERQSDFWVKVRFEDGTPRQWQSRCKDCHRAADRERVGARPRTKLPPAEAQRRRRESANAYRQRNLEAQREANRDLQAQKRRLARAAREAEIDVLVELLRTRGQKVVVRRRTSKGLTTRLVIEKPGGGTTALATAYPNPHRKAA